LEICRQRAFSERPGVARSFAKNIRTTRSRRKGDDNAMPLTLRRCNVFRENEVAALTITSLLIPNLQ